MSVEDVRSSCWSEAKLEVYCNTQQILQWTQGHIAIGWVEFTAAVALRALTVNLQNPPTAIVRNWCKVCFTHLVGSAFNCTTLLPNCAVTATMVICTNLAVAWWVAGLLSNCWWCLSVSVSYTSQVWQVVSRMLVPMLRLPKVSTRLTTNARWKWANHCNWQFSSWSILSLKKNATTQSISQFHKYSWDSSNVAQILAGPQSWSAASGKMHWIHTRYWCLSTVAMGSKAATGAYPLGPSLKPSWCGEQQKPTTDITVRLWPLFWCTSILADVSTSYGEAFSPHTIYIYTHCSQWTWGTPLSIVKPPNALLRSSASFWIALYRPTVHSTQMSPAARTGVDWLALIPHHSVRCGHIWPCPDAKGIPCTGKHFVQALKWQQWYHQKNRGGRECSSVNNSHPREGGIPGGDLFSLVSKETDFGSKRCWLLYQSGPAVIPA